MTGASHSSVKRYRELARNSPTNGLERELLLDGPHLLFEAHKSRLSIESAAFEQDALNDPAIEEARRAAPGRRRGRLHRLAEDARVDEPGANAGRRHRHRAAYVAVVDRRARVHERARRRRARRSGSGKCRRHHAHGRSGRSDGVRRDGVDGRSAWLEGAARIDGERAPIAHRARRDCRRAARASSGGHRDERARAARGAAAVRGGLQNSRRR